MRMAQLRFALYLGKSHLPILAPTQDELDVVSDIGDENDRTEKLFAQRI